MPAVGPALLADHLFREWGFQPLFEFDVELDESLFSTTAPEGYKVEKK